MHTYLLLLHETPAALADISPARMAELVTEYAAWARQMAERGALAGGEKLADDGGRWLRRSAAGQVLASDGPYAEAQDIVGGYFLLQAPDLASAEALAATCPHLQLPGAWVALRRIEPVADA